MQLGVVAYALGSGTRLEPIRVASKLNPADDPSRCVPLREPWREVPRWLALLGKNQSGFFDVIAAAGRYPRPWCFWARLLFQVCSRGFDATLGYLGEGPRPRKVRRREADLDVPLVSAVESRRRTRALESFERYLAELRVPADIVFSSGLLCGTTYGKLLYSCDWPLYMFVQAILAVRDRYPHFRDELRLAWQVAARWEADEPPEHRSVLPLVVVRAAVSLALLWQWWDFAGCFLLGFSALLRPAEWTQATQRCLFLPRDLLDGQHAYVSILTPKTRRVFRRQHARVSQEEVVHYLDVLCAQSAPDQPLFALSARCFRSRWDALFLRLGFDDGSFANGLTPACLRGSGATALYRAGADLRAIQWLGRWSRISALECYIQEVAAASALLNVPSHARKALHQMSTAAPTLLRVSTNHLRGRARGALAPAEARGGPRG